MTWELNFKVPVNGTVRKGQVELCEDDGAVLLVDEVKLTCAQDRKRFAKLVSETVHEDLAGVQSKVEDKWNRRYQQHREEEKAAASAPAAEPESVDERAERLLAEMPDAVREKAEERLRSEDLLRVVVDDLAGAGVAGEQATIATLYLVGVSRLLDSPLSARLKGPTASGKSYLQDKVARLFPPETVILATQMTPQALFHMPAGALQHRFIVGGERSRKEDDDTAEATRALREMQSSGRLSKLMPVKLGGEIVTQLIEQEGPIAYVESTTLDAVFAEDENRCVELYTDERPGQTRAIIDRTAERAAGTATDDDREKTLLIHHAMQRFLRRHQVVVPYAPRVGELVPETRVEARRAFSHLISMIRASALLHQHQREQDGQGRLVANRTDYEIAADLLGGPLRRLMGGGCPESVMRFFKRLQEWFHTDTFTTRDARGKEETSRSSVYSWLHRLHEAGALELVEEGRAPKKPAVWKLATQDLQDVSPVLPSPREVFS